MAMFRFGPAETPEEELRRKGSVMAPPKGTLQALVDFFLGSTPAERMANFGTMGFGAITKGGGSRAQAALQQIEQTFSPVAKRVLNLIGSRGRTKGGVGVIGENVQPMMDIPLFTGKSHADAVRLADEAGIPATKEWYTRFGMDPGKLAGSYNPATIKGQKVSKLSPWIGIAEPGIERGVPAHEAAHPLWERMRPSTEGVMLKSFRRRFNELATEAIEKREMTPSLTRYFNQLYSESPSEVAEAVSEIFARFPQGIFTPSGPERHLLSPVGRALAEARFPRLPDLP